MRKIYIRNICDEDPGKWDKIWSVSKVSESLRNCEINYMIPVFDRYFPKQGKILEGGCGLGKFVIYYKKKGYDIEGVDFSQKAISSILAFDSGAPVSVADITQLPFPDGHFSVYYASAMGYFEKGPFAMLKEAHRVLEDNGKLIILILQVNFAKKIEDIINFGLKQKKYRESSETIDTSESVLYALTDGFQETLPPLPGFSFHEYAFSRKEAVDILESSGFIVEYTQPVGIEQGLLRYRLLRNLRKRYRDAKCGGAPVSGLNYRSSGMFKDMIVSDKADSRMTKPFLYLLRNTIANLLILVCRKKIND